MKILAEANEVRALVEGSRQEPQGELRVAIPVFLGIDYASRVGAIFLQRYPNSRLDIRLVDSMVDPIKDGFDVVFGTRAAAGFDVDRAEGVRPRALPLRVTHFVEQLAEPLTDPAQLNNLPFIDFGFCGPRKLAVVKAPAALRWRHRCGHAPTTFRCASSTSCRDLASARCPPDHLYRRATRRQHRTCFGGMETGSLGSAHDLSVRAVLLHADQCVLPGGVRGHRREHRPRLISEKCLEAKRLRDDHLHHLAGACVNRATRASVYSLAIGYSIM